MKSLDEYRRAVRELEQRLERNPAALTLARQIEALVRFELERGLPESERLSARLQQPARRPPGRTAIISDIHGSHDGLLAALDDITCQKCDRIVCLGDLVEGGPANEEVIALLRERGIPSVRGNHDEINDVRLAAESRRFLDALPERIAEDDVMYVHISPRPIKRKIDHPVEAWNVFDESAFRLIFIGHVHVPHIFGAKSDAYGEAKRHCFQYNELFALSPDDRYIVSVGSIAYGRDMVGRIRYAIHDEVARTVELRAIQGPLLPLDYSLR
jgi:predicted phosphodiesterase